MQVCNSRSFLSLLLLTSLGSKADAASLLRGSAGEQVQLEAKAEGKRAVPILGFEVTDSLVSWFKSEDAGAVWPSAVGSLKGGVKSGTVEVVYEAGNGASNKVKYLKGNTAAQYTFGTDGNALPGTWSMCTVSRYAGGTKGRIIQTDGGNFLHGHWNQQVGVAHYDGWNTASSRDAGKTDWIVFCGTNGATRIYLGDSQIGTATAGGGNRKVTVNWSGCCGGEVSDWGIMEVMTWSRVLSDSEMLAASRHLQAKLLEGVVLTGGGPTSAGMVSWFKSEDAALDWVSAVGGFRGGVKGGSVEVGYESGNGADGKLKFLRGPQTGQYTFGTSGNVLPATFTLCSISRYTGANKKRILQTDSGNFLHGHWENQVGVAHYGSWATASSRNPGSTNWLVMCGTNGAPRVYVGMEQVGTGQTNAGGNRALTVNWGGTPAETSEWAVAEIITWNRALSDGEMQSAVLYLQGKDVVSYTPPYPSFRFDSSYQNNHYVSLRQDVQKAQ